MIVTSLLLLMCITLLFQTSAPRMFAACVFIVITVVHDLTTSDLDGLAYYGSAALADLAIIMLTAGVRPVPKMVVRLQTICITSIALNFGGWAAWMLYLPPTVYDWLFVVLYSAALVVLLHRSSLDVGGDFTVDSWRTCFRFNRHSWRIFGREQTSGVRT